MRSQIKVRSNLAKRLIGNVISTFTLEIVRCKRTAQLVASIRGICLIYDRSSLLVKRGSSLTFKYPHIVTD